jgi:WD40 repeat protein
LTSQNSSHNVRTSSTVCSSLTFHPHKLLLYGGISTGGLFCWDLTKSELVKSMEAHFSVVTAFSISSCGLKGVFCGWDALFVVWDLTLHCKESTVSVFIPLKGMVMMEHSLKVVLATGDKLTLTLLLK